MKLWVFTVCHKERRILPYFMRHYLTVADKIIIYDDGSDDGGPELAEMMGAEVRPYPRASAMDDLDLVDFASTTYPEARGQADWVIWVDTDEFIYHPVLRDALMGFQARGIDLPHVRGYAMFSEVFPTTDGQIYEEIRRGVPYSAYDKPVVFQPHLNLQWIAGKHTATFTDGAERGPLPAELKLLHFRHLGRAYFQRRNAHNWARMSQRNKDGNMGHQVYPQNEATAGWDAQVATIAPKLERVL